jgi:hypothetical protein
VKTENSTPISPQEAAQTLCKGKNEMPVQVSTPRQKTVSEDELQRQLLARHEAGETTRQLAMTFGELINSGDISRALRGEFPKSSRKRGALRLAPVCPTCEQPIRRHRPHNDHALIVDRIHPGGGSGRLGDIVKALRQLEAKADAPSHGIRVYARGGKRTRVVIPEEDIQITENKIYGVPKNLF